MAADAYSMDPALLALLQDPGVTDFSADPDGDMPGLGPGEDPKTALNTFCQRTTRRAIGKTDIVYTSQKIGAVYQAVVRLNCMDGVEFAGEVGPNEKEASKNAAKQALTHFANEGTAAPAGKNAKKRKVTTTGVDAGAPLDSGGAQVPVGNPVVNSRMALNVGLMRILHRALSKEDIGYNTAQTALGFQCTISMPSLPGEWGSFAWAGEVANKKKDAEEHAARHALDALRADPGMCAQLDTPAIKKPQGSFGKGYKGGGGKFGGGGGKGWGGGGGAFFGKGKGW